MTKPASGETSPSLSVARTLKPSETWSSAPVWPASPWVTGAVSSYVQLPSRLTVKMPCAPSTLVSSLSITRSEERRVGKECIDRSWQDQQQKRWRNYGRGGYI